MKKILFTIGVILLFSVTIVFAHEHNSAGAKQLVDSGIGCDKLTEEQLEAIGEYYMEQMHPGESHKVMDNMMGGDDSKSLKQMHIQIAGIIYCNENDGMVNRGMMQGGGMMSMMMGRSNERFGMMDNNMMENGMMTGKMTGDLRYNNYIGFTNILFLVLFIGLIILVSFLIIKLSGDFYGKKR